MQHNRKTDTLYNLIEQNPRVLEEIDLIPFVETPLHVAAHRSTLLYNMVFHFIEMNKELVRAKMRGGLTLLQVNSNAMKLLIKVMSDLHASNLMGQRAFDIINNQEIRNNLVRTEKRDRMFRKGFSLIDTAHEWIIRKTGMKEKMSNEIRNTYMIVATLIATTTYQSVLSPGGFRQVDEGGTNTTLFLAQGTSVMSDTEFMAFSTANLFAFTTSILTITWLMPKNVGWYLLYVSTWFLAISYLMSIMIISPNDFTAELMVSFYDVLLPVLAVVSFLFFKLT
ncbi:hypothetical protein PHAVU_011G163800 [Phaseolus vulgaris]|uniref:PGG domain-containing protein n=1 Tax=Phaseolus vulgaris TaxID=3885 RepID=V7AI10_PHAVU|nr:hypothetical protein PHAVU_011G163800g [Phaseolus vulgaris]ESW05237.1 hypothetical protein PHAVU_011G163800g [Phaseolus vulgaris]